MLIVMSVVLSKQVNTVPKSLQRTDCKNQECCSNLQSVECHL